MSINIHVLLEKKGMLKYKLITAYPCMILYSFLILNYIVYCS